MLIELARLFQHETYSGELVGRYGGEEFVILCPETDLEHARQKAERLRLAVNNLKLENLNNNRITASFGVAQLESGDSLESLFHRADNALYQAKETGRNRVCSLTCEEQMSGAVPEAVAPAQSDAGKMIFESSFSALISSDIVVYKLGGFVNDNDARLTEVNPNRAVMRLGKSGLLPFWGKTDDRRPIEVELVFDNATRKSTSGSRNATPRVEVMIRMTPLGWIKQPEVFLKRAARVFRLLKDYFVAE